MLYYLDSRSESIQEWLAENAEYIGIIGGAEGNTITSKDISIENVFNTPEGAAEVKSKYKGKPLVWYWLDKEKLEFCMHHMQLKNFKKEFPDPNE